MVTPAQSQYGIDQISPMYTAFFSCDFNLSVLKDHHVCNHFCYIDLRAMPGDAYRDVKVVQDGSVPAHKAIPDHLNVIAKRSKNPNKWDTLLESKGL